MKEAVAYVVETKPARPGKSELKDEVARAEVQYKFEFPSASALVLVEYQLAKVK